MCVRQVILALMFPPLIFLLEFKTEQEMSNLPVTYEEYIEDLQEEEEQAAETEATDNLTFRFV